jgi:transcription elongation GreA/GreB family factor
MRRVQGPAGLLDHPGGEREVRLGSTVRLRDAFGDQEHTIVSVGEADATHGRISVELPVGRALLGHTPDDRVEVQTPGGCRMLTVVDIATTEARFSKAASGRSVP